MLPTQTSADRLQQSGRGLFERIGTRQNTRRFILHMQTPLQITPFSDVTCDPGKKAAAVFGKFTEGHFERDLAPGLVPPRNPHPDPGYLASPGYVAAFRP